VTGGTEPAQDLAVAILADDLIWAARLADAVTAAGARPMRIRRLEDLRAALAGEAKHAIVDLTARAYDGVEAIRAAAALKARIVAVGQHDDLQLRKAALEAGAERVFAYRTLFEDGPGKLEAWLAVPPTGRKGAPAPTR
jgi:DNA-binding NarL/FixJ family response regulator